MNFADRFVAAPDPHQMRFVKHLSMAEAGWRLEFIARKFDQQTKRIREINRFENHAVAHAGMLDAARIEALDRLHEDSA